MPVNPDTTVRKLLSMPKTLAAEVSEYRFSQRIGTEAEAIRRLIELGLQASRPAKGRPDREPAA